jgi:hypothetical protein
VLDAEVKEFEEDAAGPELLGVGEAGGGGWSKPRIWSRTWGLSGGLEGRRIGGVFLEKLGEAAACKFAGRTGSGKTGEFGRVATLARNADKSVRSIAMITSPSSEQTSEQIGEQSSFQAAPLLKKSSTRD